MPVILRVDAGRGLRVRVETESGRTPTAVELVLRDESGASGGRGSAGLNEAAEGWWRDAPEGRWCLWASDGYAWISTTVEIPGEPVALRFPPAGSLRVEVPALMIETGVGAEIVLDFLEEGRAGRPVTKRRALATQRRWFSLRDLQPGLWSARVAADDGRTWMGQIEIRPNQHHDLVLTR